MTEQAHIPPASRRKVGFFIGFILFLILALSGGWYWASTKLDESVTNFTTQLQRDGKVLECTNQDVRGYPFRLGLHCDKLAFADPVGGITISGNALRSAAQLYRPGHMIAEIDSPYDVSAPGLVPLTLDWSNLKSSANVGTDGFQRISIVADQLKISANDFGDRDLLGSLEQLQLHARPVPETARANLDLAISGDKWVVDDNGANLIEPVSFNLQVKLKDGLRIIESGNDLLTFIKNEGGEGELTDLTLSTQSGGRVAATGPLSIDNQGLVSGELTLEFDDPQKLVTYAQSIFPPLADSLSQSVQYLEAFAQNTDGGIKVRDLKISIRQGKIFLGFFEIGEVPRLF